MTVRQFLAVVEIRTKLVSVSGVAIGSAYAAGVVDRIDPLRFSVFFLAMIAVDMATTALNTFADYVRGTDRKIENRERNKVLVHERVAAGPVLLIAIALYGVAALLGIWLAWLVSPLVILIGFVSVLVGILYNIGPAPISRLPVGEIFAGGFLGWVLVTLSIWIQTESLSACDLWIGVPSLFFVASILTTNNTCDIDGDRRTGRRTLSVLLGRRAGEALVYLLGAAAYGTVAFLALRGRIPRTAAIGALAAVLASVPVWFRMHRTGYSHATKGVSMARITRVFCFYTIGYAIPLFLAAF